MKKLTSCLPFNKVHFSTFLTITIFLLLVVISLSKPASYSQPLLLLLLFSSQIVMQLRFFTHLLVYVVDYACLNPPSNCRIPSSLFLEHVVLMDIFNKRASPTWVNLYLHLGKATKLCFTTIALPSTQTNSWRWHWRSPDASLPCHWWPLLQDQAFEFRYRCSHHHL